MRSKRKLSAILVDLAPRIAKRRNQRRLEDRAFLLEAERRLGRQFVRSVVLAFAEKSEHHLLQLPECHRERAIEMYRARLARTADVIHLHR